MSARSVHEVVVEAMARGMHADSDHGRDGAGLVRADQPRGICNCWHKALVANAALVASAEVREGLVAAAHRASVGDWPLESPEGEASRWWVDAILAALAGPEAEVACCDYRDHATGSCACDGHPKSKLHPFGSEGGAA